VVRDDSPLHVSACTEWCDRILDGLRFIFIYFNFLLPREVLLNALFVCVDGQKWKKPVSDWLEAA
jgi:hypothetical protein